MNWGNSTSTSASDTNYTHWIINDSASTGGTWSGVIWYNSNNFWRNYNYLPQKFKDKHGGMPLEDFLEMWKKDGYRIIEIESKVMEDGNIVKRYNVYSEAFLNDYGNHLGFVVILDKDEKLLEHEVYNIRGR